MTQEDGGCVGVGEFLAMDECRAVMDFLASFFLLKIQ